MADIRINALATTATTSASDDFFAIDGTINGTRAMSAATPGFLTSVTVPTVTSAAGANLVLATGTAGAAVTIASATRDVSVASNVLVPNGQLFGFGDGTTAVQGNATSKIININVDSTLQGQFTTTGLTLNYTTDSTTKDTGGLILQCGLGVEKAVNIGTTLGVGGNLTVSGTGNQTVGGVASRLVLQGGTADTPASAGASGTAGSVVWDASYIYVCVAANTWKRAAIATW